MNKTIFQIDAELMDVFQELEENGGELTPELEETLKNGGEAITAKVKSMCNYIDYLKSDKDLISKELDRLKALKKTKDSAISNITKLVVWAIEKYGTADKKGKQWIDWNTGKVSIRPSKNVEVYQDKLDAIADDINMTFTNGVFTNTLSESTAIDIPALIDTLQHKQDENGNNTPIEVEESDLSVINVDVTMSVPLTDILNGVGFKTVAGIVTNTNNYNFKAYVDKTQLKSLIIDGIGTNLGEIKDNKGLNIK